jgi:hypothetical protein
MGKHVASSARVGRILRALAVTTTFSLIVVAGWYVFAHPDRLRAAGQCPTTLTVVTASSFAPVVATAGRNLRAGADCVQVDVRIAEGRAAAGEVAQADADAWIPDDAGWAGTTTGLGLASPGNGGSGTVLATSPIYMVTDAATAERVRAAGTSWLGLANLLTSKPTGLRLVVRDPSASGDGMVAAGAVGEAVWLSKGMDASSLALAETVKITRTVTQGLAATPEQPGDVGLVPEYALLPTLTVPVADRTYLAATDRTAMLRYTWLPTAVALADSRRSAALSRLLAAFGSAETAKALVTAGLRGRANVRPAVPGTDKLPQVTAEPFEVLGPHHVQHVFATWDPEDRRSNLLVLVDIATGRNAGPAALEVLRQGCRSVADLLPDGSHLGLWEVGVPPRKLVPTARLDLTHRATVNGAVGSLATHRPGSGLFDAVVEAYTAIRDGFQPDMVNQVLVFTDDQQGVAADVKAVEDLVNRLSALRDAERPVHLSVVVLGEKAAADRLKAPLKPVDAYVGNAGQVSDIEAAFIHVLAGGLHD